MSREKLAALETLQAIDLKLAEVTRQLEALPRRLAELKGARDQARVALDLERGKLADNERAAAGLEGGRQAERDRVKKWESRLGDLRNAREYSALAREIDISRKTDRGAEEEAARLKDEATLIRASVDKLAAELAGKDKILDEEGQLIQMQIDELTANAAGRFKEREEAAKACDKPLLGRYEQIRKRRPGPPVVTVGGGRCSGCNMMIPPQQYHRLRANPDLVEACPSCQRIIYAPPEAPPPDVRT